MPIKHRSVQDLVYVEIRSQIISGKLKPGEPIRQNEIATTLGVSRMPVREALRNLEAEGLVTFYPRRGVVVTLISIEEFEEIYRIREELEVLAIRWAIECFDELDLRRLRMIFNDIKDADLRQNTQRRLQAVRDFHFAIFTLSKREHLLRLISGLWDLTEHYRRIYSNIKGFTEERTQPYLAILNACESKDPQALEQAYRLNYSTVCRILVPYLKTYLNDNSLLAVRENQD